MTATQTNVLDPGSLHLADAEPDNACFDVERVRQEFPILTEMPYGKPLVYLDSAATSHKPQAVIDAISGFYSSDNANVHRGVHYLSGRATDAYEAARVEVPGFLNAPSASEIVLTRGATEAINLVAQPYATTHLGEGDEVLITAMEHHSNIVAWQMVCEQRGARLRIAPIADADELVLDEFERLVGPKTTLVAVTHVSNPTLRLIGTAPDKASVSSFVVDGVHPHDIGTILDRKGVAIRTGHHCAQPLLARLGLAATARASLACYSTRQEMDALVAGLGTVQEVFG